jgi:pimeloyl-ACP methyl ester carboxylesterase
MHKSIENTIVLTDGRTLGYAEYGLPAGKPVMYFHSHPGSRINARFMHDAAKKQGIRIIAPDRPGCGLSDFKKDRTLLDWPQDVLELADHLGIEKFAVLGASGGGPYATVCGFSISQRVTKCGLLASVGPINVPAAIKGMNFSNRIMFGIAKLFPALVPYMMLSTERGVLERPEKFVEQLKSSMPKVDVQAMDEENHWPWFIEDLQEAFRCGVHGPSHDMLLYARPWGFSLQDIQRPTIIWQGQEDTNAPISMGQYLASTIPDCQVKIFPDLGHLSVIVKKAEEALLLLSDDSK